MNRKNEKIQLNYSQMQNTILTSTFSSSFSSVSNLSEESDFPCSASYSARTSSKLYLLRKFTKKLRTWASVLFPITSDIAWKSFPYLRTPVYIIHQNNYNVKHFTWRGMLLHYRDMPMFDVIQKEFNQNLDWLIIHSTLHSQQ